MVERLTSEVHRIEATERMAVLLSLEGTLIAANVLRYLNRLSDLLWLYGRLLELEKNVDSKLRTNAGPRWSRAW